MRRVLFIICTLCISTLSWSQSFRIHVSLDTSANQPLTGRLYIFTATDTSKGVQDPDPINPSPSFYIDVKNWKGGEEKILDSSCRAYPVKLNQLKPGYYKFVAVLDVDTIERKNTSTPGNWFSTDVLAQVMPGKTGDIQLYINRRFRERSFKENDTLKQVVLKSRLLSAFRKQDIYMKAAVVLPSGYSKDASKHYPVVFIIPGWGGTHYDATGPYSAKRYGFDMGKPKIYVYLNPETQTPFGLHAFVDSRVNGPWGKALVEELVPYLEKEFSVSTDPLQHFVMGQSTGGYGALWLQLHYPRSFGGCWAVSPDPVDFRNFVGVNIYEKDASFYYDEQGKERPFFMVNNAPLSTMKRFAELESFLGDGGQMQSFEAEFGIPDKTGRPQMLFDRTTGKIDQRLAQAWKPYDMGQYLLNNYHRIARDIDKKVHVYAGAEDNFFLNKAVELFKEDAAKVKANITAELIPGANHFSIWSEAFTKRVQQEIDQLIHE